LAKDPGLRLQMGQNGRKKVLREFDDKIVIKKTMEIIKRWDHNSFKNIMQKHISRIKIILLSGDIIIIVFCIYLCLAIRTRILGQFYVDASSIPFLAGASFISSLIYILYFILLIFIIFKASLSL
jgi:hypothetical protein